MDILKKSFLDSSFERYLVENNIKHIRIPLYSAWAGSAWERMIRTIKSALYKSIGKKRLDYFQLVTLLSDIQDSINSRPLTYRDSDNSSFEVISPNSFLKLCQNKSIVIQGNNAGYNQSVPRPTREDVITSLQVREEIFDHFKEKWFEDYLLSLREVSSDL